jgi:hypothetical protein
MPVFDGRSADEIIGYDEQGLPTGWSSTLRPWLQSSAGSPTAPGIWS